MITLFSSFTKKMINLFLSKTWVIASLVNTICHVKEGNCMSLQKPGLTLSIKVDSLPHSKADYDCPGDKIPIGVQISYINRNFTATLFLDKPWQLVC